MTPRRRTTFTIFCSLTFVITIWLLHSVRPDLPYGNSYVSNFLQGPYAEIAILAFFANSFGAWMLAKALPAVGISEKSAIARLLIIFAIGYAIAAISMEAPAVHGIAAYMTFLSLPLAAVILWWQKRKDSAWKGAARTSLILGIIIIWALVFSWQAYGVYIGERILILSEMIWLIWLALVVRLRLAK